MLTFGMGYRFGRRRPVLIGAASAGLRQLARQESRAVARGFPRPAAVLTLGQLPVGPCDALELRKRVYRRIKAAEAGRLSAVHRRDGWRARVESVRLAGQQRMASGC
jgi:hypothetical protein